MKIVNTLRVFAPLLVLFTAATACSPSQKSAPAAPVTVTTAAAVVTPEAQLVNAIHNFDNLSLDDRLKLVTSLLSDMKKKIDVNTTNQLGEPILADAVHFGEGKYDDLRVVKLLLDYGADVNAVSEKTHRSALTKAAEFDKLDAVTLFFQYGLEINNENGTRAVVKAAFMEHKDIVDLFLAHGFEASGKYADALQAPGMKSDETKATAALFGAYVDIARDELFSLVRSNAMPSRDPQLTGALSQIQASCKAINSDEELNGPMNDFFSQPQECSVMGRLGSLAYMHCYGLLHSNSANLTMLQGQLEAGGQQAHQALKFESVNFAGIQSAQELLAYDQQIQAAMLAYSDMLMPSLRMVAQRMAHHAQRNLQLRTQAEACGNRAVLTGASAIGASIETITSNQSTQLRGFQAELAGLEKMRAKIAYQLPALSATETLKAREEEEKKKQEEEGKPGKGDHKAKS